LRKSFVGEKVSWSLFLTVAASVIVDELVFVFIDLRANLPRSFVHWGRIPD
jgi:hypothetical protein